MPHSSRNQPRPPVSKLVRLLHNAELLNGEIFTTLKEAQIVIEGWRQHYNRVRPHSSLGYKRPAPEVVAWPASPAVEGTRPAIALRPRLN
jgi:transposase InsO family protein